MSSSSSSSSEKQEDSINKKDEGLSFIGTLKRLLTKFVSFLAPPPQTLLSKTPNECCYINIPFDIQPYIMRKLPVKSLIRFRCVSKQWKSLIDGSSFINTYQAMNNHLLLVKYTFDTECDSAIEKFRFISIIDNIATFPQHKSPITVPFPVNIRLKKKFVPSRMLVSSHGGLICFYGLHSADLGTQFLELFLLWNPSIRKSVAVVGPGKPRLNDVEFLSELEKTYFCLGVCPETNDPKIVKIKTTPDGYWEVQVYTLSSKVWKTVSVKPPCKSCHFQKHAGVSAGGFIYWLMYGECYSNLIASFDLTNEKFGQVFLPDCLLRPLLRLCVRNECLTVLDYEFDNDHVERVCNVWMMKGDDITKSFTKMFSISGRLLHDVFKFRKNGDAIVISKHGFYNWILQVYDPSLGCISGDMGIDEICYAFSMCSYMETLLLLDTTTTTPNPAGARYTTLLYE